MPKIDLKLFEELQTKYGIDTLEGQDNILKALKKMLESALEGELGYELGYKKLERKKNKKDTLNEEENYRNLYSKKKVLNSDGDIEI